MRKGKTVKNRISRRDFLKMSAVTGAVAASGSLFVPQIVRAQATNPQGLASHVTIGNTSIQSNLNPYGFVYFQARQIYDTLIDTTASGELIPGLATEWNQVDPQTLEIKLRDDVFFSNGQRFTAESVRFTLEFLRSQIAETFFAFYAPISDLVLAPPNPLLDGNSIEVIDDTNLVVRTNRPDPIIAKRLSRLFILSSDYMTSSGNNLGTDAVGTGYLKLVDFAPGERVDFETWEGNWRGNLPIQTATYVAVGDLRTALESGDIDVAQSMPPDIARRMEQSGDWKISQNPALATGLINFVPETHEALQDVRVRRALNLAINKQEFNDVVLAGFGEVANDQMLIPGLSGYNEDLETTPYDPDEARRLLAEAGYADLSLSMVAPNTARVQAEAITGYLRSIGVDMTLDTPDSNAIINEVSNGTEYNMVYWESNFVTLSDWSQAALPFMIPALVQRHIENERFYELHEQVSEATSEEERDQIIEDIATLMSEDAAAIILSWKQFFYVHTPRIESLPFHLDTSPRIEDIRMTTA